MRMTTAAAVAFLLAALPTAAWASPWITAESAAVALPDGTEVWTKASTFKAPPASTAKVMAALVAVERGSLDSWVTVSDRAAGQEPTRIGVRAGEQFRLGDLVRAALINSGNDAACALAEGVAGSESRFAELMTERAKALGAKSSVFKKASGLPATGQVTTAMDLVRIMRQALKHDFILKAMSVKETWIESRDGRRIALKNHNRLLWDSRYPVLLKTGYTRASRHCYVGFVGEKGEKGVFAFLTSRKPWPDVRSIASWCMNDGAVIALNRKLLSTEEVRTLQDTLKRKGFDPGPVDGVFGPKTLSAVRDFQRSRGLQVDGIAGANTLQALGMKGK